MKTSKLNISITKSDFSSLKIAVISTNWNEEIIKPMLDDCVKRLEENKTEVQIFFVPGAYELPFLAKKLCEGFDAIILLGCIIKGETPHFEIISQSVSDKVLEASLSENKPIIFGVLTTDTMQQALERAGIKNNLGWNYALQAIEMGSLMKNLN